MTEAGEAILPHARAAMAAMAGTRQALDDLRGLVRGRVAVGMVTGCAVTGLFDALAAFHRLHPGVEIVLSEDRSDQLIEDVRTGRLDIALVGTTAPAPVGVGSRTIADEPLVAAVRPDHALAKRMVATMKALCAHPIVCLPQGSGVRSAFDAACVEQGVEARVAFEATSPDVVAGLAVRGLGVAVLAASMLSARADLRTVTIKDAKPRTRLELIWRPTSTASPAARVLVEQLRDAPILPVQQAAS